MSDNITEISKITNSPNGIRKEEAIQLYPGIELKYLESESDSFSIRRRAIDDVIQINYCKSGQMVWRISNGGYTYLNPGDFSLRAMNVRTDSSISLPAGRYSGLAIFIDLCEAAARPPELLGSADIFRKTIADKLPGTGNIALINGNEKTESIFTGFYDQPEHFRLAYQKLKTLELLLYLSKPELQCKSQSAAYQSEQAEIIKKIHDRLTGQIGERITIEELSRQYLMNPTTLKTAFKEVYGTSIAAHMKHHRMEHAAKLLNETSMSVAEIARTVGYDSQSKFAAAFKSCYQALPREYRKKPDIDKR